MRLPGSTNAYRLHIVLKKVPKTSTEDGHVRAIDEDVYKPRSDGRSAVLIELVRCSCPSFQG